MEANWTKVLKNTLVRTLEYLYGKDEKKKNCTDQPQSRGDICRMSPNQLQKKKITKKGVFRTKQSVCK